MVYDLEVGHVSSDLDHWLLGRKRSQEFRWTSVIEIDIFYSSTIHICIVEIAIV